MAIAVKDLLASGSLDCDVGDLLVTVGVEKTGAVQLSFRPECRPRRGRKKAAVAVGHSILVIAY